MTLLDYTKKVTIGCIYFSLPDTIADIVSCLRREIDCSEFEQRYLSDYENKAIGVDDIAGVLDVTIEDVATAKVFSFNKSQFNGKRLSVYLSNYFLIFVIEPDVADGNMQDVFEAVKSVVALMQKMQKREDINIKRVYTSVEDHFVAEKDAILEVLSDKQMGDMEQQFMNRRFTEKVSCGSFAIDLIRNIKFGSLAFPGGCVQDGYNVYFRVRSCDGDDKNDYNGKAGIEEMFEKSIEYAAPFFI